MIFDACNTILLDVAAIARRREIGEFWLGGWK